MIARAPHVDAQVANAFERAVEALKSSPAALVTDIDGTISEIASTPEEATVVPLARASLMRLASSLAFVGVVTGRAVSTGAALVDIPNLMVIGNHGLEWSDASGVTEHPDAVAAVGAIANALNAIQRRVDARDGGAGILYENKRLSGTIHYRRAPQSEVAKAMILEIAAPIAELEKLRLTEGRFIVELRPNLPVNKGTAVADLIRDRDIRGMVFLGDDTTDVDAFRVVSQARESGTLKAVVVGITAPETPPEVIEESDVTIEGVGACAALLAKLADHFDAPS